MKNLILFSLILLLFMATGCVSELTHTFSDLSESVSMDNPPDTTSLDDTSSPPDDSVKDLPETIRWFNASYVIITTVNEGDYHLISGFTPEDTAAIARYKEGLESGWNVTDRTTADEILEWLLHEGGHNIILLDEYDYNELSEFTRDELIDVLNSYSFTDNERAYYLGIYDAVETYGDHAITAWDLSRALQLASWYYLVGYYTYEEAMDASLEIAVKLQSIYPSWEDMVRSYLYGFQYWNEDDPSDPTSESYNRARIFKELNEQPNGPYAIDWNYPLTKEW